MDFWTIATDSWGVMRRAGAVWRLALISTAQVLLYGLIVLGLVVPMAALVQLSAAARAGVDHVGTAGQPEAAQFASQVSQAVVWVGAHWAPIVVVIVALTIAWAVSGVLDVAAAAGMITQTNASREGSPTSAATGLGDGFRIWWRTVALLAIAALPSLTYMLAIAVYTFVAVSLPLYQRRLPDASAVAAGNLISGPLSTLVSLVGVPLGVLVALGLRFAVLEDCEWRQAFARAWRLARARLVDVALMYLVIVGITTAIVLAIGLAVGLVAAVGGIVVGLLVAGGAGLTTAPVIALGFVGAIVCGLLLLALTIVTLVWQSVAWTLFWRRVTGAEQPATIGTAARFGPSVGPSPGP